MSWQAVEAVQDYSQVGDHTALCILYAIARAADVNGMVGAGGRVTSPSIDSLAAKARCHRNTILNWLPKLEASGELLVERFGTGRGAWNRYTILLPIGTSQDVPKEVDNGTSSLEVMVQNLTEMVQGLTVLVQETVHNGTNHVVPDTKDTEEEEKKETTQHADSEPLDELIDHFLAVSGCRRPKEGVDYAGDWVQPLIDIYKQAGGNFERTKQAVSAGVVSLRSAPKPYTIASPGSIQNAAVSWLNRNAVITAGEVGFR